MVMTRSLKTFYINLSTDKKFPIIFGEGAFSSVNPMDIGDATKAIIVTNSKIREACSELIDSIQSSLDIDVFIYELNDGEQYKQLDTLSEIINVCIQHELGRKDLLIAVGGGVVGDITGFAASVYLRGIPFFQVPTSLLAQVDAAIGGKTGVNHEKGKNLIGSFYQPVKTLIDPSALISLSETQMKEGLAEIIKYGVIADKPLFWYIEQHSDAISTFSFENCPDIWYFLIEKSIHNKALVVSQDEKELRLREILNYGHTIGHAIEAVFDYNQVSHGEAVALGMMVEAVLSNLMNQLSDENLQRIIELIKRFEYRTDIGKIDEQAFFSALQLDKKVRKGEVRFIIPVDIGQTKTVEGVSNDLILQAMRVIFGPEII